MTLRQLLRARSRRAVIHAAILGCGVAICTLAFAVGDGILLQRLPFPAFERLIWIGGDRTSQDARDLSQSQYDVLERRLEQILTITPYMRASVAFRADEETERMTAAVVGGQFFALLGIRPLLGRFINDDDDHEGAEPVVVLSENLWHRAFGANPDIAGGLAQFDDRSYRVVGVVKSGSAFPLSGTDVWMPLGPTRGPMLRSTDAPFLSALARVRQAATISPRAAVARVSEELHHLPPARVAVVRTAPRYVVQPLLEHLVGATRPAIVVLAGAAGFLMLISCLAAATIQLARYAVSEREVAIRAILGATPLRLWREVVADAALSAGLAASVGLALTQLALYIGHRIGEAAVPELHAVHLNARVFLFAAVIAGVSGLAVMTIPLLTLLRSSTAQMLQRTSHTASTSKTGANLRDGLIGVAVAVTLLLVLGSVVAANTLLRLVNVDMGFVPGNVASASVRLPFQVVTPPEAAKIRAFVQALENEMRVRRPNDLFAVSTDIPGKGTQSVVTVQSTGLEGSQQLRTGMSQVSPDYFAILRVPVLRGRTFATMDNAHSQKVIIIDAEVARRLYGQTDPVGQLLTINELGTAAEVIGVVGTVRQTGRLAEAMPQIYLPFDQLPLSTMAILLREDGSASATVSDIRGAVRASGSSASVTGVMPLEQQLYDEVRRPQFYSLVLAILALLAMVVSAGAVHSSVAALVAQRTHEIGIRMALGATRGRIVAFVLGRVAEMMALGSTVGLITALVLWQGLVRRGFAIGYPTAVALVSTLLILWLAGAAAVVLPVLRATRIPPLVALTE